MSRRKDRERFASMKASNSQYQGFRGHDQEGHGPAEEPMTSLTCTVCGRKRNVLREEATEQGVGYVCLTCREEKEKAEDHGVVASEEPPLPPDSQPTSVTSRH